MEKNILIIEDDDFFMELLSKKILAAGFSVTGARDRKEGMEKIKKTQPDLILLDLLLPAEEGIVDVDGFRVLEEIKKNPKTEPIPVIILSNLGQKEDIEKGLKLGAKDFLIKAQFSPAEIIEKIKEILR